MITVLHRGVPENDYSVPQILGYYFRNIISTDLTKIFCFFDKIGFLSDMSRSLQYYVGQIYYGNTELVNRLCFRGDH